MFIRFLLIGFFSLCLTLLSSDNIAFAGAKEQAHRMHRVIASVNGDKETLAKMTAEIEKGDLAAAAKIATESPYFYDLTLKNMFAPLVNVDVYPLVELNDAVSTMIGVVRDDKPFTDILSGDILYTGAPQLIQAPYSTGAETGKANDTKKHYRAIEALGQSLKEVLVENKQSDIAGIPSDGVAGILTTQAWGEQFYTAGTNRRPWMAIVRGFGCQELEQITDSTLPNFRIRRDVERAPSGDTAVFSNKCAGCHAMLDAVSGAFSYVSYTGNYNVTYKPGIVDRRVNQGGNTYPKGYVTIDDSWVYLGSRNPAGVAAKKIGWRSPDSGSGVKSLGRSFAQSRMFSECMSRRVFSRVCGVSLEKADKKVISKVADSFEKDGSYSFKGLFGETAKHCLSDKEGR